MRRADPAEQVQPVPSHPHHHHHRGRPVLDSPPQQLPQPRELYPVPAPPTNYFPYIFVAYFAIGIGLLWNRTGRIVATEAEPIAS